MSFSFTGNDKADFASLNKHLAANSYIEGWGQTQNDVKVFGLVPRNIDASAYPHISRWAHHIASFPPRVRSRWAKGKVTLEDQEEKKAAPPEKKASNKPRKGSDTQPEKKDSKKDSDKGKKDKKKDKKGKKQKEEEPAEEETPAPIEEEAAEEQAPAEDQAPAEEEAPAEEAAEDDTNISFDDLGLNDDDDDDEATKAMFAKQKDLVKDIQARQAANAGKAKSNLTLDVGPYDTETDMSALEAKIRSIKIEGLKWLGGQLVDVAYGIKKLRIMCQLVDVLVNPDTVREEIEKFDDEVQSTDVFAFQMA